MKPTPNVRGRHAWCWVVGVGLVFVVVVGMALRRARIRHFATLAPAWLPLLQQVEYPGGPAVNAIDTGVSLPPSDPPNPLFLDVSETKGGTVLRGWTSLQLENLGATLIVQQHRSFFGSRAEAHMFGGTPAHVEAVRTILASVGVELVVEP